MDELIRAMSDEELVDFKDKHPSVADQVDGILQARNEAIGVAKTFALRDRMAIGVANKILGKLPEYTPDWRKNEATQCLSITTVEVDDENQELIEVATNGEFEWRHPKMLVRFVSIGVAVTPVRSKSEPVTRKRKVKDVYRLGSVPLELLLDGGEHEYYTWNQIIADINENHRELLRVNGDGQPESIIETTASGAQDLRTAGFLGVER